MRFYIYRHGSNACNQPMTQTMQVAVVEASDEAEACELAERRVTVYNNQYLTAQLAEEIDAEEAGIDERVQVIS